MPVQCRSIRRRVPRAVTLLGIAAIAFTAVSVVEARMYQWVNPGTRSPQLSGTPPSWYRSEQGGPRVRVYDSGNLVDDTAIALPRAQAQDLRDAAFEEYELRRRADALRQLERAALEEKRRLEEQKLIEQQAAELLARQSNKDDASAPATSRALSEIPDDPEALSPADIERLKALLGEFDRQGGDLRSQ